MTVIEVPTTNKPTMVAAGVDSLGGVRQLAITNASGGAATVAVSAFWYEEDGA